MHAQNVSREIFKELVIAVVHRELKWEANFFFMPYTFVPFELYTIYVLFFQNFLKLVIF